MSRDQNEGGAPMDPFEQLVAAIDAGSISDVEHCLQLCNRSGDPHFFSNRVTANGLTVFGHVIVNKSDPQLLDILFGRPEFNVNRLETLHGEQVPLLHLAAYTGNAEAVTRLCSSHDIDLTADLNISAQLLVYKDGIDVNASGFEGFTALHLASWNNHLGVVNLLLAHPQIDPQVGSSAPLSSITKFEKRVGRVRSLHDKINRQERRPQSHVNEISSGNGINRQQQRPHSHVNGICSGNLQGKSLDSSCLELMHLEINRGSAENSPFLYPELYNIGVTALHCAVLAGHVDIVEALVRKLSSKVRLKKILNAVDNFLMTPLHYAIIRGDASIVEELLTSSTVRGNLEEERKNLTPLDMAYILIHEAKGLTKIVQEYKVMISMLSERSEVKVSLDRLYSDRQVFVDAANAILVGAALIASITFVGWLQPPLGFQPYYDNKYLLAGSAPPGTFESFAAVQQHFSIQVFWIFNSLSFCFAIVTMLTGAGAVLPCQERVGKPEVQHICTLLIRTSITLSVSVFCVLGAFMAAGFSSLPPSLKYQWGMIMTSVVGGGIGLIVLYYYYKRMFRLFRLGNVSGRIKQVKRVWHILMDHESIAPIL